VSSIRQIYCQNDEKWTLFIFLFIFSFISFYLLESKVRVNVTSPVTTTNYYITTLHNHMTQEKEVEALEITMS